MIKLDLQFAVSTGYLTFFFFAEKKKICATSEIRFCLFLFSKCYRKRSFLYAYKHCQIRTDSQLVVVTRGQ